MFLSGLALGPTWANQKNIHVLQIGIPFRQQTCVLGGSQVGYIQDKTENEMKLYIAKYSAYICIINICIVVLKPEQML